MSSPLPFDAFMRKALYDPKTGYYTRQIETVGGRGDFTTAPMISDHLARGIAQWAAAAMRETKCRHLIEIGPGTGQLAQQVWQHLPWHQRLFANLHLVETSPKLTETQRKTLSDRANWHASPTEALKACGGKAVIYSNELVDAFPCRRFQMTAEGWREIAVELTVDGAVESLLPKADLPPSSIFAREFAKGQCIEVHDSYREWLQNWLPLWKVGRLLTLDYGAEASDLYHRQPDGSIRAYLLQQRLIGPAIYENIGRQDLTADVNFTDLLEWSRPWTSTSRLQSLGEFLASSGAQSRLLDPEGAGAAFQALEQQALQVVFTT